jgi:hypothetical protein
MTRTFLAALALAVAAAQPAFAAGDSTYAGGCAFASISNDNTPDSSTDFLGVIYSRTVVYSPTANPVSATVTCSIEVGGVTAVSVPFSGTVVVAGWQLMGYTVDAGDVVRMCETVDFTDATPTVSTCRDIPVIDPTELVRSVVDVLCSVSDCGAILDQVLCPFLAAVLGEDGDVYAAGERVYDCPPYGGSVG